MKKLILLTIFLVSINIHALPNCPSDLTERWHNCFGSYPFDDGSKYVGEWKDDGMNGQGTYTWSDGAKYVGEFKDGKKHGQGTYTFANGNTDKGYYMNGDFIPDICKGMGLAERTEAFGNCVVELIKQLNADD